MAQLDDLPAHVAEFACGPNFAQFLKDPFHPSLSVHKLDDTKRSRQRLNSYAVSVGRRYRAIFVVDGDVNVWY